jgi:ABC-type uncharacterized transport system permease subunit
MSLPPHGWSVPPPPPGPDRPIRTGRVFGGIGLAFLGQVVAIGLGALAIYLGDTAGVYVGVLLQVLLFVACLVLGIVWIARRDRGLGLGLLIGWGVTVLVFPVVGIGVCIALLNNQGSP